MILFLVLTIQKKKGQNSKCTSHASIFRVEPCSLDSNQVKLHFGHKIDNGRGLYMKCTHFKFTSFVQQDSNNQLIVWQESWAAQIWSRFCGGDPKLLLYIPGFSLVREKNICNADNSSFASLFDTHLTGPGRSVFYIFQGGTGCWNNYHILSIWTKSMTPVVESWKRPTNHGCELRSFKTKLFINIWSTPSHDIKLKIEKTQGQGEEWLGVVIIFKRPRARARSGWVW